MRLEVFQIDAWREPDRTWTYNNSMSICFVEVDGDPTPRKIIKALRNKEILPPRNKLHVKVDDYFTFDRTWCIQKAGNSMPLFDLIEQ